MPIPASNGYFNFGEAVIYVIALTFGPIIGGISGGVGSMIADLILLPAYAPGTLVIKFFEGFVVGYIFFRLKDKSIDNEIPIQNSISEKIKILTIGAGLASLNFILGYFLNPEFMIIWVILGILLIITSILWMRFLKSKIKRNIIISIIPGAFVMVFGYVLYGTFAFTWIDNLISGGSEPLINWGAIGAIPFDTTQCLGGLLVAIIVYQPMYKSGVVKAFALQKV